MTAHRRPLLLSVASSALACPACLFIPVQSTPLTPPEARDKIVAQQKALATEHAHKDVFGELPSRPGEVVATKPATKDASVTKNVPLVPQPVEAPSADVKTIALSPGALPPVVTGPTQSSPLIEAVKAYADGKPNRAIEILKSLDAPNQEFVLAMVPILARGATADLATDPAGVAALVDQLETTVARLETKAALRIENIAFCGKVAGFGRYDLWPEGQPYHPNDQAQLYLEVENLQSVAATGPHGETHLTHAKASVEIKDAHGVLVKQPDPEDWRRRVDVVKFEKKLFSRGPVHDFHVLYAFPVPTTPGVYTVTVEIRDPANRKVRSTAKEFRVTGP